ncbi:Holliday junction resolvase [Candidatus Woesearchaeota archaeon CG_4_10_14_0_2_um_filter_33_13]|nr:MAG: Holliday junction resolvase [Candidatus Woesearchaeota archaeon CG_4_10_14_0_2_um_filter_33_13]
MKNHKAKGTKGERDLVKAFNLAGWGAIRIAGSGSSRYPSPDILAGNAIRRLAIECKVTKEEKKYFQDDEIVQLDTFSKNFGAEAWIGVKFPNDPWFFVILEDLVRTGKGFVLSLEQAQRKGLKIEELLQLSNENRKI